MIKYKFLTPKLVFRVLQALSNLLVLPSVFSLVFVHFQSSQESWSTPFLHDK